MRTSVRWLCGIFVVAWVVVCIQPLRSELVAVATMRSVWSMDATEKRLRVDGPIYEFLEKAREVIPGDPNQEVYLFAVDNGYTYYKANYYLYPRSLYLIDPANADSRAISAGSYFIFFIPSSLATERPDEIKRDFDRVAGKLPPVVKVFRTPNAGIYRVVPHG